MAAASPATAIARLMARLPEYPMADRRSQATLQVNSLPCDLSNQEPGGAACQGTDRVAHPRETAVVGGQPPGHALAVSLGSPLHQAHADHSLWIKTVHLLHWDCPVSRGVKQAVRSLSNDMRRSWNRGGPTRIGCFPTFVRESTPSL